MHNGNIAGIDDEIVHRIYRIQVALPPQIHADKKTDSHGNQRQSVSQSANTDTSKKKLGRNNPCYCGSGKKYKKCHYPN